MVRSIFRTPRARQDLIEIWSYIAHDNPNAADRLLDRIDSVLETLRHNPHMGRARPELQEGVRSSETT